MLFSLLLMKISPNDTYVILFIVSTIICSAARCAKWYGGGLSPRRGIWTFQGWLRSIGHLIKMFVLLFSTVPFKDKRQGPTRSFICSWFSCSFILCHLIHNLLYLDIQFYCTPVWYQVIHQGSLFLLHDIGTCPINAQILIPCVLCVLSSFYLQ
jgi:hypothetical protein